MEVPNGGLCFLSYEIKLLGKIFLLLLLLMEKKVTFTIFPCV